MPASDDTAAGFLVGRTPTTQTLEAVGNTIRHVAPPRGRSGGGMHTALVIGDTLTCHFWLNILPLARDEALRHFVTVSDLAALAGRLHVRPTMVPCFLVFSEGGYAVDWFPAPLPAPGCAVDHAALLEAVRERLRAYGAGSPVATQHHGIHAVRAQVEAVQ